ncbi:SUN domain-containing protein 2-like [Physella acuta]|uniref:SUN domain-containing protein 2-like n=1 Tax=Physella acuta TaxID=109671 RepID=UPI0027DE1792|nr:SUN domain-containing protein 2-like [Physella acuta]
MVFGVLFAAFLYFYGLTLMYQVMRLVRIMIHSLLPASWLMSTSDIVNQALYKYNADRVGLADYALESAGGSVICNSDTYHVTSGTMYSVFGLPVWYHDSDPREVIRPDVQPGKCWAMHGTHGFVTIGLAMPIVVTAVSLEHIPKELATSGKLDSAPNEFLIVGQELTVDSPEVILGRFTYKLDQDPIQVFQIKDSYCQIKSSDTESCGPNRLIFRIITLKVQSNYGNSEYTCIYRLRVHGTPMPQINRF